MNELSDLMDLANANPLFSISISIVIIIGLLEGVLSLVGAGMSSMLDSFMPELNISFDMPDSGATTFSEIFSWLNKGRVPVLMLFLSFLTFFGLFGLIIQNIYFSFSGTYIYTIIVAPIAFVLSLILVRIFSVFLSKIMPKDETTAISTDLFIGNIATIGLGTVTHDSAVEAKFKDRFNETHYIRVKSLNPKDTFSRGDSVYIHTKITEKMFLVVANPNY